MEKTKMVERAHIKYDAQGLNERRFRGYGVFVWRVDPSSEYYADPEKLDIQREWDGLVATFGEGPLPYSSYNIIRKDFHVSGSLSGNQDYLQKSFDFERIPMEVRNETLRLVYDHPTWLTESVVGLLLRIEIWNLQPENYEDVVEDEDEDQEEIIIESAAAEEAVWLLEKVTIRGDDCVDSNSDNGEMNDRYCTICLEGYRKGSEATKMPCSHVFHGDCITTWLEHQCFCPLCRFRLMDVVEYEQRFHNFTLPDGYY